MNRIKRYLSPGETARILISHSEVCMYMGVAGRIMEVQITSHKYPMAQLFDNGKPFSAPITLGEAGLYQDSEGIYCYPEPAALCDKCAAVIVNGEVIHSITCSYFAHLPMSARIPKP